MTVDSNTRGYEFHECMPILQQSKNMNSVKRPHAVAYRYTAYKQKINLKSPIPDRRKILNLSVKI